MTACLNLHDAPQRWEGVGVRVHKGQRTLLSRSSSLFSHSNSLYRLLTEDSFSLKMGMFVCVAKTKHSAVKNKK